ncbi:unnamed protein product [Pleuronectes platessa]|uniref:Uncharacterized protein n=1 Tax=Pleuronectes platessa TaxID=8262 RepID=A0A9N7W5V9_PLEPL|nr:unnamed protein product [Pleuronectes platessa]
MGSDLQPQETEREAECGGGKPGKHPGTAVLRHRAAKRGLGRKDTTTQAQEIIKNKNKVEPHEHLKPVSLHHHIPPIWVKPGCVKTTKKGRFGISYSAEIMSLPSAA